MIKVTDDKRRDIGPLFDGIWDSMVIAYLQGYQGDGWVDRMPDSTFGMIVSGEYSFFGGDAGRPEAKEMIASLCDYIAGEETTAIYAPENLGWRDLILETLPTQAVEVDRHWIVQKDYDFDREKLKTFIDALPEGYALQFFDAELYRQAMSAGWSSEFCETFESAEDYLTKGFGIAVVKDGQLVAGTSTMTVYDGGTEIQVATREDAQGQGLATAAAARFILECQKRGIRPCWDAANDISLHMAQKLGYEYNGIYSTVHIRLREHR